MVSGRGPSRLGPWIVGQPHATLAWAWRCHHADTGRAAIVEVHFFDNSEAAVGVRRAIAANPHLVTSGAERIIASNTLVLAPDEGWPGIPPGEYRVWVAREDRSTTPAPSVDLRMLRLAVSDIESLGVAATANDVPLDLREMVLEADGSVYLRRPGLAAPVMDFEHGALDFLRNLPLDDEARATVGFTDDFGALVARLSPSDEARQAATLPMPGVQQVDLDAPAPPRLESLGYEVALSGGSSPPTYPPTLIPGGSGGPGLPPKPLSPVRLEIPYPERLSRLLLFVKWIFVWPLLIWLSFYGLFAYLVEFFALVAILFTGRYPPGLFNFVKGYINTQYRVSAYWPLYMTDRWRPTEESPLRIDIDQPPRLSRLNLIFAKIPALVFSIVGTLIGFGVFAMVIVVIPVWFCILVTGRYPRGLFNWSRRVLQWAAGLTAWSALMSDDWSLFGRTKKVKSLAVVAAIVGPIFFVSSIASHNLSFNTNVVSRLGALVGVPEAMKVVDQFMIDGRDGNVDAALALTETGRFSRAELTRLFASKEYFAGYTGTTVTRFNSEISNGERFLDIEGKVHYVRAPDLKFRVFMTKVDGRWRLSGISISR